MKGYNRKYVIEYWQRLDGKIEHLSKKRKKKEKKIMEYDLHFILQILGTA